MNIKKIIKLFIPEIILILLRKIFKFNNNHQLFDGFDELFKKNITKETVYGEYGCGDSTLFVMKNFDISIYSVDTSIFWINKIKQEKNDNLNIKHIDLGEVGQWGRPKNYKFRNNFFDYFNWIWEQEFKPNVVLIDGRFRVCCFLTSLKLSEAGTKIIFDDYVERERYHIIEEFLKPVSSNGRQSLFIVPEKSKINLKKIDFEINNFSNVMD